MTTNKIPTDEEFAEGWWTGWAGTKSELFDFIKAVRAAGVQEGRTAANEETLLMMGTIIDEAKKLGAEEQREKDAKIAEKFEPSQKQDYVTYISQAIRTQPTYKEGK